jgi:hypothetical protein
MNKVSQSRRFQGRLEHPHQILAPCTARRSAWVAQEAEASRLMRIRGRGAKKRGAAAQTFQFALPNLCFQSLMTPGGNSRLPTPVRRQASGHISSKE